MEEFVGFGGPANLDRLVVSVEHVRGQDEDVLHLEAVRVLGVDHLVELTRKRGHEDHVEVDSDWFEVAHADEALGLRDGRDRRERNALAATKLSDAVVGERHETVAEGEEVLDRPFTLRVQRVAIAVSRDRREGEAELPLVLPDRGHEGQRVIGKSTINPALLEAGVTGREVRSGKEVHSDGRRLRAIASDVAVHERHASRVADIAELRAYGIGSGIDEGPVYVVTFSPWNRRPRQSEVSGCHGVVDCGAVDEGGAGFTLHPVDNCGDGEPDRGRACARGRSDETDWRCRQHVREIGQRPVVIRDPLDEDREAGVDGDDDRGEVLPNFHRRDVGVAEGRGEFVDRSPLNRTVRNNLTDRGGDGEVCARARGHAEIAFHESRGNPHELAYDEGVGSGDNSRGDVASCVRDSVDELPARHNPHLVLREQEQEVLRLGTEPRFLVDLRSEHRIELTPRTVDYPAVVIDEVVLAAFQPEGIFLKVEASIEIGGDLPDTEREHLVLHQRSPDRL